MSDEWWVGYAGDDYSFRLLRKHFPELKLCNEGSKILLGGPPLGITKQDALRDDLNRFTEEANILLVLLDPNASPIKMSGLLYRKDENGLRHHVILEEPERFSWIVNSGTIRTSNSPKNQQRSSENAG